MASKARKSSSSQCILYGVARRIKFTRASSVNFIVDKIMKEINGIRERGFCSIFGIVIGRHREMLVEALSLLNRVVCTPFPVKQSVDVINVRSSQRIFSNHENGNACT
jgi:hypothetical protein